MKSNKVLKMLQSQSFQVSTWSGRLALEAFLKLIWLEKMQNCVVKSPKSNNQSFPVNSYPGVTRNNSVKNIPSADILLLCKTWKYG